MAVVSPEFFEANRSTPFGEKLFAVDNTHEAHRELAALFRQRFHGKIIAVAGSSGKTTTKEFLYEILSKKFRCMKTEKSQNGELGIPRTLERLDDSLQMAVIEVGIDGPGDMVRHANLVQPDLAVLTSIGEEHLNLLKNIETVFAEEKIIFDVTIKRGGRCFAPKNDPFLGTLDNGNTGIDLVERSVLDTYAVSLANPYSVQNASLAVAVALKLGMSPAEISEGIRSLKVPEGRGQEFPLATGGVLLADHYNSNPSSLKAGLEYAQSRAGAAKKGLTLILGDMLDLGDESKRAHDSIVSLVAGTGAKRIFLVGPMISAVAAKMPGDVVCFKDSQAALNGIPWAKLGSDYVLAKGSRGVALEVALQALVPGLK